MQQTRHLRNLFPVILVLLCWSVIDINVYSKQINNFGTKSPLLLMKLMETRRANSGKFINYRLDPWSQYDNPEEGTKREGDINQPLQSRKIITTDQTLLWPNGIVNYYIHSSIGDNPVQATILKDALRIIMSKTCIKFVRIHDHTKLPAKNWVNITGHEKGCFSDLGRNRYGPTILNLNVDKCFNAIGHVIHEMLHALGVYHEHMRPDRDEYITIIWENIKKEDISNFYILNSNTITNYGLPYDYDSVMHYSMTAFSINKTLPTIIPMLPFVEIGQRNQLSYYDIKKLQITYNCTALNTKTSNKKKKPNRRFINIHSTDLLQSRSLNKTIIEREVKPQEQIIIIYDILNQSYDKNINLGKPTNRFNQKIFSKPIDLIQPNTYFPIPLNPIYPIINFQFYLHKK